MNFSMFSCSHLFLPNRKQSVMSKRGQEGTSGEGSAMAKPRSMNLVMAKPRLVYLVSHNLLSTRMNYPQDLSDSNNPVNAIAVQGGVSTSVGQLTRDTSQNSAEDSQVRQQENTQNANTWKQEKRSDSSDSTSVGQLTRGMDTHMNKPKMECRNMQVSKSSILGKGFPKCAGFWFKWVAHQWRTSASCVLF